MKILGYEVHPAANDWPLLQGDEFASLVESIRERGLLEPVGLFNGQILDGRNRALACQKARVDLRTVNVHPKDGPWLYVIDKNAKRRHMEQAAVVLCTMAGMEHDSAARSAISKAEAAAKAEGDAKRSAAAKEQHAVSNPRTGEKKPTSGDRSRERRPEPQKDGARRTATAALTGASVATVGRVERFKEAAPELAKRVQDGEITMREAVGEQKLRLKAAVAEQIRAEPKAPPAGPFRVIAIDPPWKYDSRVEDASHRGRNPYPDMTIAEISALPVAKLAHADCVLWMWTTNAFMHEAFHCVEAWGFIPKTILTWDKQKLGLGDWLRNTTEHCILAVRGHPIVELKGQTTLLSEARREHSRKPEAFYALVEGLCPGNKLEMFARQERPGWESWGAEKDVFS
jgi:N6-adenosine-specific RNA methylase IME4